MSALRLSPRHCLGLAPRSLRPRPPSRLSRRKPCLSLLAGLAPHLAEGCLGTIGEIFDGNAPHTPRGLFARPGASHKHYLPGMRSRVVRRRLASNDDPERMPVGSLMRAEESQPKLMPTDARARIFLWPSIDIHADKPDDTFTMTIPAQQHLLEKRHAVKATFREPIDRR